MTLLYGDGSDSTIGTQFNVFHWQKKALVEAAKVAYFGQMSSVVSMPKHMGKTIRKYHYIPLLDERNVNDQGLDAAGADMGAGNGNLYGGSKDIGTITARLPTLREEGGRVNRVGFTRIDLSATISRLGFFDEFSQESLTFDTDAELLEHLHREMITAAHEMTEAALQADLLNAAGTVRFGGEATADNEISGIAGEVSDVTYEDLMRLSIDLDNNRTPKDTQVITGSRMVDTKTISASRIMFIGTEMIPMIKKMVDLFDNPAFIPVEQYAHSGSAVQNGNAVHGEIGKVDQFRIVVVPEMMHWAGAGKAEGVNSGYRVTGGNYDIYPLLVVGSGSFVTIGFQTDGKSVKFTTTTKMPGKDIADIQNPYGEIGFSSIKWYYGTMILRPERIALVKCVAEQ